MSLGGFLFVVSAAWCIIHVSYYLCYIRHNSLLPLHGAVRQGSSLDSRVTVNGLQLRISTTKWNGYHDQLIAFFARRRNKETTALMKTVYNVGVILGALGMVSVILLCVSGLWQPLGNRMADDRRVNLFKRVIRDVDDYQASTRRQFTIVTPIIPGLTVPLNHLPIMISAVFISQAIHEVGHAAAAAVEALPIVAAGASLTVCLPAAFVVFSSSGTNNLKRGARARIIAAGPFHNFAFWVLLALLTRLGIANLSIFISGYKNVSAIGKVVVDVDMNSPLFPHLRPGSIVTQLDDNSLSSSNSGQDEWVNYLTSAERSILSFGWCVDRNILGLARADSCCGGFAASNDSALTCFVSFNNPFEPSQGCIDPVAVFVSDNRCGTAEDCGTRSACVSPHQDSRLMRLKVRPRFMNDHETLVLWSGPAREIFEEVEVSVWLPRALFLPLRVPLLIQNFWEYLSMATLSLYLFNLLPLPLLDGTQLLEVLIDMIFKDGGDLFHDIESLDQRIEGRGKWRKRVMRLIHSAVVMMLIVYLLLAVLDARSLVPIR